MSRLFGRSKSSKKDKISKNIGNNDAEDDDAVFLEAMMASAATPSKTQTTSMNDDTSETSATSRTMLDESSSSNNNNLDLVGGDATQVFKKKSKAATAFNPFADDDDDDDGHANMLDTSMLTVKASNGRSSSIQQQQQQRKSVLGSRTAPQRGDSARMSSTSKTPVQQQIDHRQANAAVTKLSQWHARLVRKEAARRHDCERQWQSADDRLTAWRELVKNGSVREVNAAARWVTGLALARDQLLLSLELGHEEEDDKLWDTDSDDDDDSQNGGAKAKDDVDELPELLKEENETDEVDTNAAALPIDDEKDGASIPDPPASSSSPLRRNKSSNALSPPVVAVTVPRPTSAADKASGNIINPHDPVLVLFKQHNLLHQSLLTALTVEGEDGLPKKVRDLALQLKTVADALDNEASAHVRDWKDTEDQVQAAWETYFTMAEEMLEAGPELPGTKSGDGDASDDSDDGNNNKSSKKHAIGDVWLAELAYRCAVQRQVAAWADRGPQLEKLLGEALSTERQRRLKLRHALAEGVLQKHAAAFERVQTVHTEALENYFEHNKGKEQDAESKQDDTQQLASPRSKSNDSISTKRTAQLSKSKKGGGGKTNNRAKQQPKSYNKRERMERMAKKAGTTPVFDDTTMEEEIKPHPSAEDDGSVSVVDMDSVDPGDALDLKESELPLLKDAAQKAANEKLSPMEEKKKKQRDKFSKIKSGVILDRSSNKNAMFLDRILYSGSLLESHYILMAVVAGIEEDAISPVIDDSLRKFQSKPLLVVITSDRIIHMFPLPRPSEDENDSVKLQQREIVPGSSPDAALLFLLRRQAKHDVEKNNEKEKVLSALEEDAQAARPKFIMTRTKTTAELEEAAAANKLQFHNLRPTVSFAAEDYSIRAIIRGENCIKISIKDRDHYDPVQGKSFSKLNFASASDQQAFLLASELQTGVQAAI